MPGETSSFPLNKVEDVWQIVPICSVTLTNVTPGSSLCLSWASCLITLAAVENHEKSKEWAQTGPGSWRECCNHVWWLIVGSVSVGVLTAWVTSASDRCHHSARFAQRLQFSHIQPSGVDNGPSGSRIEGPQLSGNHVNSWTCPYTCNQWWGKLLTELNTATQQLLLSWEKLNYNTASEVQFLQEKTIR